MFRRFLSVDDHLYVVAVVKCVFCCCFYALSVFFGFDFEVGAQRFWVRVCGRPPLVSEFLILQMLLLYLLSFLFVLLFLLCGRFDKEFYQNRPAKEAPGGALLILLLCVFSLFMFFHASGLS